MERFIKYISKERVNAYKVDNTDTDKTILDRYLNNIELGKAFYPLLDVIEVTLRNKINDVFIADFGEDWIINNIFFDEKTKQIIKELIHRLKEKNKEITNYRLVSELTFGFWSNLFNKNIRHIWQQKKRLNRVFNYDVKNIKEASKELTIIRQFRNRVFHYETLYNHNPDFCHKLILKYISAMTDNEFMAIIYKLDTVNIKI